MYLIPAMIAAWFSVIIIIMILMIFIRRIFEIILLYIVSPLFVAPMPLDEGAKFKAWKDAFIGKCISGFSSIIMLRLFLMFMPMIWTSGIRFAPDEFSDNLLKVLFMCGGMYTVYKSHTMITGLVSQQAAAGDKESAGMVGHYTFDKVSGAVSRAGDKIVSKPFDFANKHLDNLIMPDKNKNKDKDKDKEKGSDGEGSKKFSGKSGGGGFSFDKADIARQMSDPSTLVSDSDAYGFDGADIEKQMSDPSNVMPVQPLDFAKPIRKFDKKPGLFEDEFEDKFEEKRKSVFDDPGKSLSEMYVPGPKPDKGPSSKFTGPRLDDKTDYEAFDGDPFGDSK